MQYFNQLFEVSEEEIRRVEEDYSFLFPEPYRLFLSHNISKNQMIFPKFNFEIEVSENKLIQAEMSFYVMVNGIPIWISGFFDFDSIKYFLNEMKNSKNWEKYNKNKMLIIAETGNGNSWCIGIGKSNYGKVFFEDIDFIPVEEDFNSFINNLNPFANLNYINSITS